MVKADDIFLFVQVVDEGSFSRVAEKLAMTNSVVSKRISRLEQELNVQLFYRTTRKLNLTEAGHALYGKARLAKQALQDAQDTVTGYGDAVRGKIKVTVPVVSAHVILSRSIAEFCKLYPDVEIELIVTNRMVDIINDGFDLAIRTADLEDSSLIARRLIDSRWVVCASPGYVAQHGKPPHPAQLKDHQCLIYKYEGVGPDNWQFSDHEQDFYVQVVGRFHANSLESIRQALLNDFGIAYLPQVLIHEDLKSGRLVPLLDDYAAKNLGVYAVYPRSRQPDKKLNLLVEHFRDAFQHKKEYFY
ncbi:LysR family transcriptional regulator [Thalassotalea euphylliae]|uniref:LysR family transcriptional regulator n=1 Tax=Thalassotalea euphylliae TaxID=1655234 RepID=A0A3E0UIM6_9GAMM|nr:LysR family transcriptional regulator [Thalassotalea euphylliae]REL36749.1 LysR family transcriptional regulator [Thalassotalea euphylliae]